MTKLFTTLVLVALCIAVLPTSILGQNLETVSEQAEQSIEQRGEVTKPIHHDRSRPLREMFDTNEKTGPARGGRDFEPGRPLPVDNTNPVVVDPLVERSVSMPSALSLPKAGT